MGTAAAGLAEPQALEQTLILPSLQVPAPEGLSHSWLTLVSAGGPDMSSPLWSERVHWGLGPSWKVEKGRPNPGPKLLARGQGLSCAHPTTMSSDASRAPSQMLCLSCPFGPLHLAGRKSREPRCPLSCLHPGCLKGLVWRLAEELHLPFLGEPRGWDGAGSWNIVM